MESAHQLTESDLRHLLRRLAFASTTNELAALRGKEPLDAFDTLWSRSNGSQPPIPAVTSVEELREKWIAHMASTDAPLRENLVLFFHGLVGCSTRSVKSATALSARLQLLRREAFGTVPELLGALVLDPSIMQQIGMSGHGRDRVSDRPAKLILDHWTTGPGAYEPETLEELSRSLTGWTVTGSTSLEARFDTSELDAEPKTLFGVTSTFDASSALKHLARQPATAKRFCEKWCRHFGAPPALQKSLEQTYLETDGSMYALLRTLVTADAFWVDTARWSLIKSPVQLAVGACRQLALTAPPAAALDKWLIACGQSLLDTPNNGEGGWADQEAWLTPPDRLAIRYALSEALLGEPPQLGFAAMKSSKSDARARTGASWTRWSGDEVIARLDPAPGLTQTRRTVASVLATPQYQLA